MYSDPTERNIEPTQLAYPYSPYDTPIPPPPPSPDRRLRRVFFASLCIACLIGAGSGLLYAFTHPGSRQSSLTRPTSVPTALPTVEVTNDAPTVETTVLEATTAPTVAYYASDIYNDFVANNLGGPDPKDDTNWTCCTYTPEGGAIVWTESNTGHALDLATFVSIDEAETDGGQLYSEGYYFNVVHGCLLSYERAVPQSIIGGYLAIMQAYCN